MITASYLFAPDKYNPGEHVCFYCGLPCDETYKKKEYVKNTFTNRDIVRYPGSDYVCGCCVASLITGDTTTLIDGDVKTGRGGSPRMYSWILSSSGNHAFSKRHIDFARESILNPPEPPFSIILADSGQKQLIFRASVNHDRERYVLLLEEKRIEVDTEILRDYLDKAVLCSAAIGKIALKDPDHFINYKNVIEFYGSEEPLIEWINIYSSPMGMLAAWLCPGKQEAQENGNVISRRIPSEVGGISGPITEDAGDGGESCQGRSNQILFDLA
jgi:CRISPR type IV-associated protein Csf1